LISISPIELRQGYKDQIIVTRSNWHYKHLYSNINQQWKQRI